MSKIQVLKFGGTSLQTPALINQAADIVRNRAGTGRTVVVVSAIGGVTDRLAALAEVQDVSGTGGQIEEIKKLHLDVWASLSESGSGSPVLEPLETLFKELQNVIYDTGFKSRSPGGWRDRILSVGERASAHIFAHVLSQRQIRAQAVEAQTIIKTDASFGEANVLVEQTRDRIREYFSDIDQLPVITGFIGSTSEGEITTLGRSGSDYTASLVADALDAGHIEIWTDVDGVLTADPRIVPAAQHIDQLNYEDIDELAANGGRVFHPKTIRPIRDRDIPVQVKNSRNPSHPGTAINRTFNSNGSFRSITVAGPFVYIETSGELASELTAFFDRTLITDEELESIAFNKNSGSEPASFLIRYTAFDPIKDELLNWAAQRDIGLTINADVYLVKKFCNRLRESDELLARSLHMLSKKQIRPLRIRKGHNQRFFSLLLQKEDAAPAARLLNDYLLNDPKTVDLFIAGTGAVGGTLLEQLREINPEGIKLRVVGICNSRTALWDETGISLNNKIRIEEGDFTRWTDILEKLKEPHRHNTIFVDATGSQEVARLYPELQKAGIHIATPSKLANTFEQSFYNLIHDAASSRRLSYRYETTVGAGLPVISTIKDLRESGDTITEISGVVSGTMTYLFGELEKGKPFSEAVTQARDLGYAEPDPRDDLSGEDVARKFLILARAAGLSMERDQLEVDSLIPGELAGIDREKFLQRLPEFDEQWKKKMEHALESGSTLRYTGRLHERGVKIGVQEVSQKSPLGQLQGTDNLIRIFTRRYSKSPIIIQGPGAGKEVTAAGVLADIQKIIDSLD